MDSNRNVGTAVRKVKFATGIQAGAPDESSDMPDEKRKERKTEKITHRETKTRLLTVKN
ncbi:hypothetical protein [[Clostridium] hylemonae]|uniref:hypothetical protein n=1 Tax=[Clostridium] hylemonae TaxID=89153 RepID=UPI001479502E|nr:hypothetical protein [[Clostridium] hylemonae]